MNLLTLKKQQNISFRNLMEIVGEEFLMKKNFIEVFLSLL